MERKSQDELTFKIIQEGAPSEGLSGLGGWLKELPLRLPSIPYSKERGFRPHYGDGSSP